jgi:hypothetical protein
MEQLSSGVVATSLSVLPSNGTAGTAFAIPNNSKRVSIAWQIIPTGGPSALSNALQISMDNSTWTSISTDTTTAGCYVTVNDIVAKFVRIYHTSHTGGTGLTGNILLRNTPEITVTDQIYTHGFKALTDNTAIPLLDIALPAGAMAGGMMSFTVICTNGTDQQAHSGIVNFAAVNKAGTFTKTATELATTDAAALTGSSTITMTWSWTDGTNKVTLNLNANSSLTPTYIRMYYTLFTNCPQAFTIL